MDVKKKERICKNVEVFGNIEELSVERDNWELFKGKEEIQDVQAIPHSCNFLVICLAKFSEQDQELKKL